MNIRELVAEMKILESGFTFYEEKYEVLNQDFYNVLMNGQSGRYYDEWETRPEIS